jgi:hypothetical protein
MYFLVVRREVRSAQRPPFDDSNKALLKVSSVFAADAEFRLFLLRLTFSKTRVEALAMVWGSLLGKELADYDSVTVPGAFWHVPKVTVATTVVELSTAVRSRNGEGCSEQQMMLSAGGLRC